MNRQSSFDEHDRLAALRAYGVLDTPPVEGFDELARLAAHVCRKPISLIDFVDTGRVWVKASVGFPLTEIPRDVSFADRVIAHGGLTMIADARADERLALAPFVIGEPYVRFCAGVPLLTEEGLPLGTVTVMDPQPSSLSAEALAGLSAVCRQVMTELRQERMLAELQRTVLGRERAEEAMVAAETKFRTLVEQIPAIAYIWDMDPPPGQSHHLYTSPRSKMILGFTSDDWVNDPDLFDKQIHPDDRARVTEATRLSEETGEFSEEYRLFARDGRTVWFRDEAVITTRDERGAPKLLQGVLFDITERKRMEEALERAWEREREAADHLRALDQLKNLQLHAVAHDLRGPITGVLGSALELQRGLGEVSNETRDELLEGIVASARKLSRLVTDLLDLDRLERGITEPDLRPVDVAELARRVVQEVAIKDHPVIPELVPVTGLVDPVQVERILENLLLNAAKHTPAGTPIWICVRPEAGGVLLVVEDAGPGVAADLREEVFRPFRRVGDRPGLGIGLSLVARYAELLGGRAWVEDRGGGGASFRVSLAASGAEQETVPLGWDGPRPEGSPSTR